MTALLTAVWYLRLCAMGSSQSQLPPSTKPSTSTDSDSGSLVDEYANVTSKKETKKAKTKDRSGMELVNYQCRKDKRAYNKCVDKWYTKGFMTGNTDSLNQEEACGELFETYRLCILRGIRSEYWEKEGLPPPDKTSPLAEVEDEDDRAVKR